MRPPVRTIDSMRYTDIDRHPFATVHRYAGAKLTVVDGIRVTTIPQSLFDVASRVSPWNLGRAMDDAILGKRLDINDLKERLDFYVGSRRPGLPRIRPRRHPASRPQAHY